MKIRIVILAFICSFMINSSAQDTTGQRIEKIKMECDRIDKEIPKLRLVRADVDDQSTEGGEVEKYYEESLLRKAVVNLFGETGKLTAIYYFDQEKLIFVSETELAYELPIWAGKTEIKSKEQQKFYFTDQKLALWVDQNGLPKDPSLYAEKEKEFMSDLKNIINKNK